MSKVLKKLRAERENRSPINPAIAELKKQGYQFKRIKGASSYEYERNEYRKSSGNRQNGNDGKYLKGKKS